MKTYTNVELESLLKPCPFCGGKPYYEACDVLIQIGCHKCDYNLHFDGLLSHKRTIVEVPVKQKDGTVKYHDTGLYYHKNAHELAVIGWNKRKGVREK